MTEGGQDISRNVVTHSLDALEIPTGTVPATGKPPKTSLFAADPNGHRAFELGT